MRTDGCARLAPTALLPWLLVLPTAAAGAEGDTVPMALYLVPALTQPVQAGCAGRLEPDQATISGAVSAEGVKPTRAHELIEERLEALRAFVAEAGGRLELGERLRAVQDARDRGPEVADQPPPFLALQSVEVVLPAGLDVDAVLDRLLQLGLDRLGRDLRPGSGSSRPQVAVHFGLSDAGAALEALVGSCKLQTLQSWCGQHVPAAEDERCRREMAALEPHFEIQSLQLRSQPVPLGNGGRSNLAFSYPWRDHEIERLDLAADVALELSGSIVLRAALPQR